MMVGMSNGTDTLMDMDRARQVGELSRIALTDEQARTFGRQLADMLAYVGKLRERDTAGVEPMVHAVDLHNVLGPDIPQPSLTPDEALSNAPDRDGDFFKVPKVLGDS